MRIHAPVLLSINTVTTYISKTVFHLADLSSFSLPLLHATENKLELSNILTDFPPTNTSSLCLNVKLHQSYQNCHPDLCGLLTTTEQAGRFCAAFVFCKRKMDWDFLVFKGATALLILGTALQYRGVSFIPAGRRSSDFHSAN